MEVGGDDRTVRQPMSEADLFLHYYLSYLHYSNYRQRVCRLLIKTHLMRLAADYRFAAANYRYVMDSLRRQQQRLNHWGLE